METTATQGLDMIIQQTEWPNSEPTTGERIQLAVGFAINDALEAACRFGRRVRSLGR